MTAKAPQGSRQQIAEVNAVGSLSQAGDSSSLELPPTRARSKARNRLTGANPILGLSLPVSHGKFLAPRASPVPADEVVVRLCTAVCRPISPDDARRTPGLEPDVVAALFGADLILGARMELSTSRKVAAVIAAELATSASSPRRSNRSGITGCCSTRPRSPCVNIDPF